MLGPVDAGRDRNRRGRALTSGRVGTIVSVLFGLFVLFDIALFGWLILRSLSEREVEEILLETQSVAQPIAEQLREQAEKLGQEDLFVVVSVTEDLKKFMGTRLLEREFVHSVQIRDRNQTVVYEHEWPLSESDLRAGDGLEIQGGVEAEVPIGDLGSIVIGISETELERRSEVLRRDLVRQASLIGAMTVTLLCVALVLLRKLFRRADDLEKQAAEAERMAMIGTLASGLAHEIRNPLNSLNLNMQMLEEEARSRKDRSEQRLLEITSSEITRLENLATDFLSYARPRPLERRPVAAGVLFGHVAEVLASEARSQGAELSIHDESAGRQVEVDRDQMNQLLINLTKNALAATAETGRPGRVELRAYVPSGGSRGGDSARSAHLVLEVADNGGGISEQDRSKIFDLFYSTRKGGTGLGLAIVERIARSHGAEIEIDTAPGESTTVRLLLPMTR